MNIIENFVEKYLNNENEDKYKIFVDPDLNMDKNIVKSFVDFCLNYLQIQDKAENLKVVLSSQKQHFTTFAFFEPDKNIAAVYCKKRALLDCFRSLAHELVHYKQDINNEITPDQASEENDGVDIENQANAIAGIIIRKFGRLHPDLYE